jgi:hypothetical protein
VQCSAVQWLERAERGCAVLHGGIGAEAYITGRAPGEYSRSRKRTRALGQCSGLPRHRRKLGSQGIRDHKPASLLPHCPCIATESGSVPAECAPRVERREQHAHPPRRIDDPVRQPFSVKLYACHLEPVDLIFWNQQVN